MPTYIQGTAVFESREALPFSKPHEEASADAFQFKQTGDYATAKCGNICPLEELQTFKGNSLVMSH